MANLGSIGTTGSFGGGIVRYGEKAVSVYAVNGDAVAHSGTPDKDARIAYIAPPWLQASSGTSTQVYGGGITFE